MKSPQGRDLAFWLARRSTGLTYGELGERAGGLDYAAVSMACRKFERAYLKRAVVKSAVKTA